MQQSKRFLGILCALAALLLPAQQGWASGGFIGNGGNGVEIGGRLFVEDLVLLGIHEHPFFGTKIDSALPALPSRSAVAFDYPKSLLARKLTDINRACPGIGDYILESIKRYNWLLEDFPLVPIPDPQNPVVLPPGSTVVQIANRFGSTIRIHAGSWARLDDENKVALMIHEAAYSFLILHGEGRGVFYQPAYRAREVAGQLFRVEYLSQPASTIYEGLKLDLNLPDNLLPLSMVREKPRWKLVYGIRDSTPFKKTLGSTDVDFGIPQNFASLQATVLRFCHSVAALKPRGERWIGSYYTPRAVAIDVASYRTGQDESVMQTYLTFSGEDTSEYFDDAPFVSVDKCASFLAEKMQAAAQDAW